MCSVQSYIYCGFFGYGAEAWPRILMPDQHSVCSFSQRTLEWLGLPVLADPFRGRLPWLMEAPWRKTQQA